MKSNQGNIFSQKINQHSSIYFLYLIKGRISLYLRQDRFDLCTYQNNSQNSFSENNCIVGTACSSE
jgi:hypothetical protein